ncbi:MAG: hypothetical protein IJI53_09795 [Clostridia bacterium]|nr:hypothetical protein [Clostridia bacterium]MBR0408315.1 hypothetical protein [Clostridia bacterium]
MLLLDDSLESYAEQANWEELIAVELQRNRALEDQRYAVADKLLKIMCAALAAVLVAASTAVIVLHRKKK